MVNHEPTIMANQNNQKFGTKIQSREWVLSHRSDSGIRIFDPMLFEDTVVSKIMENFNTKCYVMNDEGKLFQQKQSLEILFLLMKKTRAKKFKVRMLYHLQNLFWVVFVRGGFDRGFSVLIPSGTSHRTSVTEFWPSPLEQ